MKKLKPCSDCPFMVKTPLQGAPEWLVDVIALDRKADLGDFSVTHTCHQTDPKACGFKGVKQKRECVGFMTMLVNKHMKTPGKDGVYKSIREMAQVYVPHWAKLKKGDAK